MKKLCRPTHTCTHTQPERDTQNRERETQIAIETQRCIVARDGQRTRQKEGIEGRGDGEGGEREMEGQRGRGRNRERGGEERESDRKLDTHSDRGIQRDIEGERERDETERGRECVCVCV